VAGSSNLELIKSIEDRLANLPKNGGVWADRLDVLLGDELCERLHLHVKPKPGLAKLDSSDELHAKAIWQFRRLVNTVINRENFRRSARVAFNVLNDTELRKLGDVEKRVKLAESKGLCGAKTTVSGHMRKEVIPKIARELTNPQPEPPMNEVRAIISEFRGNTLSNQPQEQLMREVLVETTGSRADSVTEPQGLDIKREAPPEDLGSTPSPRPWRRKLTRSWIFRGIVVSAGGAVLAAAIIAVVSGAFSSQEEPSAPIGTGLITTIHRVKGGAPGWLTAFPSEALPAAKQFLDQQVQPDDPDTFMAQQLDAGAYAVDRLVVYLGIESTLDSEATIYNIRVISTPQATPTGAYIALRQAAGGTDYQMVFNLDTSVPVAKEDSSEGTAGEDFFSVYRPGIRSGEKISLEMYFHASSRAYSFLLEIDYEVKGKLYRMTVDRNGMPFRITPSLCGQSDKTYEHIRYNRRDGDSPWQMSSVDQSTACQ
jgi:hypothetical protein